MVQATRRPPVWSRSRAIRLAAGGLLILRFQLAAPALQLSAAPSPQRQKAWAPGCGDGAVWTRVDGYLGMTQAAVSFRRPGQTRRLGLHVPRVGGELGWVDLPVRSQFPGLGWALPASRCNTGCVARWAQSCWNNETLQSQGQGHPRMRTRTHAQEQAQAQTA